MSLKLTLPHGLVFEDLYSRHGLLRLDQYFLDQLSLESAALHERLVAARAHPASLAVKEESALLIEIAPLLERFLAALFGVETEVAALAGRHADLSPLYEVKRLFVQRQAAKMITAEEAAGFDAAAHESVLKAAGADPANELAYARRVIAWQQDPTAHAATLEAARRYAAWAVLTAAGRARHEHSILFRLHAKMDPANLVPVAMKTQEQGVATYRIGASHLRRREGFTLTDPGDDLARALGHAHYCIYCHNQGKDSCSKGLREKTDATRPQQVMFKKSPFGVALAGCPLEQKISEFQFLMTQGLTLSALAVIVVDNPMVAGTGHRICNDCMKACIYQKQEPVNTPQAETRTLKDVLALPWGFEIYSLMTRWNPLNLRHPYPAARSGHKVLVAGMGPAGYTLSHYLLNDGHLVVGIDGLKIEPLPPHLAGVAADGNRVPFEAVHDVNHLYESLDERGMAGFGGVAEYGITVRWDKNFLKVLRLLLERRQRFAMFGGVRFGGTLTVDDALALGFDHIALALGAGKPTTLDIPNGLARGVRTASDFLMALQLTGAAKRDSLANMQLRLPVVVIGGGLTAIDTATEALAYYPLQVEKFLARHDILAAERGEETVRADWSAEEREIGDEFIAHARALRAERAQALAEGRPARIVELLQSWGGSTIAYRRRLVDSPSYTLNHEEVEKALEEGITFMECLSPVAVDVDACNAVAGIRFKRQSLAQDGQWRADGDAQLPARAIFIAAGTQPNTVLAREDAAHFTMDGKYFRACDEAGNPVKPEVGMPKPRVAQVLLSQLGEGRFISFFGDLHPSYFGNVVKAMASAKQGAPIVSRVLAGKNPATSGADAELLAELNRGLRAVVHAVNRLTPTIVEVVIHAPYAARQFRPGQFYRLQNFETLAPLVHGTRLASEGMAMTGAWVDVARGLVSTIVLEMGGSSSLCAALKVGEPVILMGPTGSPTEIESGETVVLVGGGLGNAVLFSIGQAFRAAGSKVLYFAGYKKMIDRYKVDEIERAADVVVWCCDEDPGFAPARSQDMTFVGNIVEAMLAYASGKLGEQSIALKNLDRLIVIGSDRMMAAVGAARHGVLAPFLRSDHRAFASINSPMQCMLKEICAQCLQPHKDPVTGAVRYVFSCMNQDQPLDEVDFPALNDRLRQNAVQEKLTAQWIGRCLVTLGKQRVLV